MFCVSSFLFSPGMLMCLLLSDQPAQQQQVQQLHAEAALRRVDVPSDVYERLVVCACKPACLLVALCSNIGFCALFHAHTSLYQQLQELQQLPATPAMIFSHHCGHAKCCIYVVGSVLLLQRQYSLLLQSMLPASQLPVYLAVLMPTTERTAMLAPSCITV
jgi:hypothetical protein